MSARCRWLRLSDRPTDAQGIVLTPLQRSSADDGVAYPHVRVALDRAGRRADVTVLGPPARAARLAGIHARAHRSGRLRWRANWTTRSCTCG